MKIRNGFVSNSSSSSYVIGVAKVVDEEKLKAFCKQKSFDAEIYTTEEALNATGWSKPVTKYGDKTFFKREAFDGNEVTLEINPDADEKFVSLYFNDDLMEDEDGTIAPDIVEDGGIYSLNEEHGVTDIQTSEGWGRDG